MKRTGKPFKFGGRWFTPSPVPKRRWAGWGRRPIIHRVRWAAGFRFPWTRNDEEGRWDGRWACRLKRHPDKIIAALNGEHVKSLQRQALDAETDARAAGERPITGPWATVSRGDKDK